MATASYRIGAYPRLVAQDTIALGQKGDRLGAVSIENMMGTVRRVCRNVKRWRNAAMALRWDRRRHDGGDEGLRHNVSPMTVLPLAKGRAPASFAFFPDTSS